MTLPPFELRPTCVKCGGDRMLLRHIRKDDVEWMLVTCERCGFEWAMKPKDAK